MAGREWIAERMDAEVASVDVDTASLLREVRIRARRYRIRRALLRGGAVATVVAATTAVAVGVFDGSNGSDVRVVAAPPASSPEATKREDALPIMVASVSGPSRAAYVSGVLEFATTSGCPALRDPAGELRPIVWPMGWSVSDAGELALRDADRDVVAVAGDVITGGGGLAGESNKWAGHECATGEPFVISGVKAWSSSSD